MNSDMAKYESKIKRQIKSGNKLSKDSSRRKWRQTTAKMWLGRYTSEMEEAKRHMTEARGVGKKKVKTRKNGKRI